MKKKSNRYRTEHRDRYLEVRKSYAQKNKDRLLKEQKDYRKSEKGLLSSRLATSKRRSAKKEGSLSVNEIQKLLSLQKNTCIVCRKKLTKYHVDHVIPLSKGGDHNFFNVQILCQPCNQAKHNKDPINFMQSQGYLL
jgi:5-methylcytosine-specific restriction endonuclease McrA